MLVNQRRSVPKLSKNLQNDKYTWSYIYTFKCGSKYGQKVLQTIGRQKTRSVVGNYLRSCEWADLPNGPPKLHYKKLFNRDLNNYFLS